MDQAELEIQIAELETRLDRLRALYEQYFVGIEKLEPGVPRKDVERRFYVLRREQIRNTGQRFRFNMLVQRFNTLSTHWQRITRQIENGTYKRDLMRAKKRFGVVDPGAVPGTTAKERERLKEKELSQSVDLDDAPFVESDTVASKPTFEETNTVAAKTKRADDDDLDMSPMPGAGMPKPKTKLTLDDEFDEAFGNVQAPTAAAPPKVNALAPKTPGAAMPPPRPPLPAPGAAKAPPPVPGKAPPLPPKGAPMPSKAPPPLPGKAPPLPAMRAGTQAPPPMPMRKEGTSPALNVNALKNAPISGSLPPPKIDAAAKKIILPRKPVATPTTGANAPAAAAPPPRRRSSRPPKPPAAAPTPAAANSRSNESLSDERVRQIYTQYVDAKRSRQESTASITYDNLAKSLRESSAKLEQKHGGKKVDFEVTEKDGKTILRPIVK